MRLPQKLPQRSAGLDSSGLNGKRNVLNGEIGAQLVSSGWNGGRGVYEQTGELLQELTKKHARLDLSG